MRKIQRAIREARTVLADSGQRRAPVDIFKIARLHADVVEMPMPDSISGMLVPAKVKKPAKRHVIMVNSGHAEVRKRFTVAHELGHLRLHDFQSPHADTVFKIRFRANLEYDGSISEEIEANHFAAELLMPTGILLSRVKELELEYDGDDDAELDLLAREFKVSKQALQIRLSALL